MSNLVNVKEITKTYGKKGQKQFTALKGISFEAKRDDFIIIMGASGSGKTTLLNVLSTLGKPTTGRVEVNGKDISNSNKNAMADFRGKEIGFIFQDFNLLENLSVRENIALPLSLQNYPVKKINPLVEKVANRLEVTDLLDKYPAQLSGGQKRRVAASRALVHEPAMLLADEPTGALDSKSARELLTTMEELNEQGVTTLMVTHDPFSASFGKRIIFIKDGKVDSELAKGDRERKDFYQELIGELGTLEN